MATCWQPGAPVQLSYSDNPRRKLAWTLERVDMGGGWIGVNTARPNQVVAEAIGQGRLAPLRGYRTLRREVQFDAPGPAIRGEPPRSGAGSTSDSAMPRCRARRMRWSR